MKNLKAFEYFLEEGIVREISSDKERSKSLIIESERKMNSLKEQIEKIGVKNENSNDYVEYCYNIMMNLIRSRMLLQGYTASGHGAHEAEVAYLRRLGFTEKDIQFADQIRFFRNGILYYGTILEKEYAEKVIEFTKKTYSKLKNL